MRTRVKKVMDEIDTVLAEGGQDAADLWAILTAERGPDDDSEAAGDIKSLTTCVHRRVTLPKLAKAVSDWTLDMPGMLYPGIARGGELKEVDQALPDDLRLKVQDHFRLHFNAAVRAVKRTDHDYPEEDQ